jgi:hypothetical protein
LPAIAISCPASVLPNVLPEKADCGKQEWTVMNVNRDKANQNSYIPRHWRTPTNSGIRM